MVIRVALVVIGLPVVLVLIALVSIYFLDRTNGTIVSSGEKRKYLLYVPGSYDRAKPTPLVISMHALALWPAAQMETSQWNRLADEHGFIVVYPSGTGLIKIWRLHEPEPEAGLMEDVRFISDLIDTLKAAYSIDPTRIYANGFSNGGAMASVLSCALSDRIAAVGTVAPAQDALLPWSWFADCRPVPMMQFHGTADPFVPYGGGLSWPTPRPFPSVSTWAANWARRNRCGPNPIEAVMAADVSRLEYTNCADDATVVLYTVRGGGHSWPGGKPLPEWWAGRTSRSIDATSQMWTFFRDHRLPRK
jgi:polyhydroxybutyrate depolymerase